MAEQDFDTIGPILSAPTNFFGSRLDRVEYTSASQMLIVLRESGMLGNESIFGDSILEVVNTE